MDPKLTMTVLRREHDQRMKALMREGDIRRALGGDARPGGGSRSIAVGLHRALRLVDAGWASLSGSRWRDNENPTSGSGEGSIAYGGEPAAA
jgi:hypothetical protein